MVALSQMQTSITLKRAYTVFVFTVSFVLPNILILAMYTKIFRTASSLIRRTPAWTRQKPLRAKFVRSEKLRQHFNRFVPHGMDAFLCSFNAG